MAATDWSPGQRKLLALWGPISGAVLARADTATLWATIRDAAARYGVPSLSVSIQDVNAVRSLAVGNRAAMERLQRAAPSDMVTGAMIGQTPLSRSLSDQARAPEFIVRYLHEYEVNGVSETHYMSSIVTGSLTGTTLDSLLNLANEDAEQHALDYGVEHVGVGDVELLAR